MTHSSLFDPGTTEFHLGNAIELAKASELVYEDIANQSRKNFEQVLHSWQFNYSHCFGFKYNQADCNVNHTNLLTKVSLATYDIAFNSSKPTDLELIQNKEDTQAFLAGNSKLLVLCFRGTEKLQDWITNLKTDLIKAHGGEVHQGFYQGLASIWDELIEALKKAWNNNQPLLVTGHSLGGALATLAVARLLEEKKYYGLDKLQINGLYTFGSPRVGNQQFAEKFNQQFGERTFRFVNKLDIVTQLVFYREGYRHVGCRVYGECPKNLFTPGKLQEEIQTDSWIDEKIEGLFEFKSAINDLLQLIQDLDDYIGDHNISNYIGLLKSTLDRTETFISTPQIRQERGIYAQCVTFSVTLAKAIQHLGSEAAKTLGKTEIA